MHGGRSPYSSPLLRKGRGGHHIEGKVQFHAHRTMEGEVRGPAWVGNGGRRGGLGVRSLLILAG